MEELAALKATLNEGREGTAPRLTTQDCLTAHVLMVLNRCLDKPIKRVSSVASVSLAAPDEYIITFLCLVQLVSYA
jgi:hypothetical protein